MRFFKEYWAENRSIKKQKTALIKKVLRKTNQRLSKKRKVSRELRKYLRKNAKYLRIKTGRYVAVFDRAFCQEAKSFDFIEQIDALMDKGQILKNGDTSYVSRLTWNDEDVVVKRYNHRGFIHSLRHTIKRSRARRSWLHGHRLGVLGIATPKPSAYIEQYKGKLIRQSYLVTEYVEGQKLYDFLRNSNVADEQRSIAMQQVKNLLDKLGKYRITHGDLKHPNILITENGPVLTDLDGMKVHKCNWTHKIWQAKDLERFAK
jgi:tRNA A-37 threonylcarbamoyl transferase component Bud32